jgi:uncharacterized protein
MPGVHDRAKRSSIMLHWRKTPAFDIAFRMGRAVAIAWVVLFAGLGVFQRKLLYPAGGFMQTPAQGGFADVSDERLVTADGLRLVAWYSAPQIGKPTLLMFHGNSGTVAQRAHYYRLFRKEGWGFYAMSYRGFSGNPGAPTEAANVADALLAYDALRAKGVAATDIILFGESLGSGVAVQVAAQRPAAAVILDSPYSSIADVASAIYWYLPVRSVLLDHYESTRHIKGVTVPVLIVHGEADRLIPVRFARALAAAAPGGAGIRVYSGVEHVQPVFNGALDDIKAWVSALPRQPKAGKPVSWPPVQGG